MWRFLSAHRLRCDWLKTDILSKRQGNLNQTSVSPAKGSMRWAIDVYFKEAKQHLGFLKEQSNHDGNETIYVDFKSIRMIGNNKVELLYLLDFKKTEQSVDYSINLAPRCR